MQQKEQITSHDLYEYLKSHGIKLARIAELVGLSEASLNSCFNHYKGFKGVPRGFNSAMTQKLTGALEQVADAIRSRKLVFGSERTYTNQRGKTYDPALVDSLKKVGEWVNLTSLVWQALQWTADKKKNTLVSTNSKAYGCVSEDDVHKINATLEEMARVLSGYRVVPDGSETTATIKKGRACEKRGEEKGHQPWEDTSLPLIERYERFHRLFPDDGIVAFSVNGGYTVCEDDARMIANINSVLQPYTDPASGFTTLYMDAKRFEEIRHIFSEEVVAVTPMYSPE